MTEVLTEIRPAIGFSRTAPGVLEAWGWDTDEDILHYHSSDDLLGFRNDFIQPPARQHNFKRLAYTDAWGIWWKDSGYFKREQISEELLAQIEDVKLTFQINQSYDEKE